jgi:hypothetical protein
MILKEFTQETLPQGMLKGQAGYNRPFIAFYAATGQVVFNQAAIRTLGFKANDFIAFGFDECTENWYFYQHDKGFMLTNHKGGLRFSHTALSDQIRTHFGRKPEDKRPFRLYVAGEPTLVDGRKYFGLVYINKD